MQTIKKIQSFKIGSEFIIENNTIKEYLQYTEYPNKLKKLLKEINIKIKVVSYNKYFINDKENRIKLKVTIKRDNKEISFNYGLSINDSNIIMMNNFTTFFDIPFKRIYFNTWTDRISFKRKKLKKIYNSLLYNILCCIKCDYKTPLLFEDFCDEFGYNIDSRKNFEIHQRCIEQYKKLRMMFNEKEIDCLPD